MTTEQYISKASSVHNNFYSYALLDYVDSKSKVCVSCPLHGDFFIVAAKHMAGQGCCKCGREKVRIASKELMSDYIAYVKLKHNNKYNYSKLTAEYRTPNIVVGCAKHGEFEISAASHRTGRGCGKCGVEATQEVRRHTTEEFIRMSKEVHGEKYDYSETNYVNNTTKVTIRCKEHGTFSIVPCSHKAGVGCMQCGRESMKEKQRGSLEDFISIADIVHDRFYDYTSVRNYVNDTTLIDITCRTHGVFRQTPSAHKVGKGCIQCNPGGYSKFYRGYFYILKSSCGITKVGITNRLPEIRAKKVSSSSGKLFSVEYEYCNDNGLNAFQLEQQALAWLRLTYESVSEQFDGYTECFTGVNLPDLVDFVERAMEKL